MRRIAKNAVMFWVCCLVAISCFLPLSAKAADIQKSSINVNGVTRTYTIYLPDNFSSARRYPIVMMIHGGLGTGDKIARQTGLGDYVDRANFVAVFPDSSGKQWNDGRETTATHGDDVGFLLALARDLVSRYGEPGRVFVGGPSNGGIMTQRLACEASDMFAAYAVALANMPVNLEKTCRPSRRMPMVFFSSVDDPLMKWEGGGDSRPHGLAAGGVMMSAPQTIDFWAKVDGCGGARTQDLPHKGLDTTSVKLHDFGDCGLIFYEIHGAGHTWPGMPAPDGFARRIVGDSTMDINATEIMLNFFRRYGM